MTRTTTPSTESREQTALRELGHTEVSRRVAVSLVIAFLVLVVSVPITQRIAELIAGREFKALKVFTMFPTEQGYRDFERALDDDSVVGQFLLPRVQDTLLSLGAGNEMAYVDGEWLFFRPGVDYVTGPPFLDPVVMRRRANSGDSWRAPIQPDPVRAIVHFYAQLRERGIELIVVPTQIKAQTDPSGRVVPTGERVDIDLQNPSFEPWWEALVDRGVAVHYATSSAGVESGFLKTDTHWTAAAMVRNARSLASGLRELLGLTEASPALESGEPVEAYGDIADMMRLADRDLAARFAIERVNPPPAPNAVTHDRGAEVLVLGDSFCNIYSQAWMGFGADAGFVEHLAYALRRPVDRITINDSGAFSTRRALRDELARGNDLLAGKRVVVWQFAIRELAVGDWQILELPEVGSDVGPGPAVEVSVRGRVLRRTTVPRPGTVPYADCWFAVELTEVEVLGLGERPSDPVIVMVAGMRANAWTEAATWVVGREVELDLIPWDAGAVEHGSYQRNEFDEFVLEAWWGAVR